MADVPFDLQRFVDAQAQTYDQALAELRDGEKRTHWMWFVFPQLAGLGHSGMAQHFAIPGLEEARAYAGHPTLGRRLVESARILTDLAWEQRRRGSTYAIASLCVGVGQGVATVIERV